MSRLLWIVLVMLLTISVSAQDGLSEKPYRLRQPTLDDYIFSFHAIAEQWEVDNADELGNAPYIYHTINTEIEKYFDQLSQYDPELLYSILQVLSEIYGDWIDRSVWGQALVLSWLDHNELDLSETDQFEVQELQINVSSYDLNGDRIDEYVLDIRDTFLLEYFMVVQEQDGYYKLVKSPLPWFGCCFSVWSQQSGKMEQQDVLDLTGDGIPEWILAESGYGGSSFLDVKLYLLQWQDGELVDIAPEELRFYGFYADEESIYPTGVNVIYQDVDSDDTIEVIVTQDYYDSWRCASVNTRTFGWNVKTKQYQLSEQNREFDDTAGCNLRFAQDAIWEADYSTAIPLLERSIAQFSDFNEVIKDSQSVRTHALLVDFKTYATIRLALSYAMTDQIDKAKLIINETELAPEDILIDELLEQVRHSLNTEANSTQLCFTMYNLFDRFYTDWQVNPYWGATDDYVVAWAAPTSFPPRGDSAKAGCDAPALLDKVKNISTSTTRSPLDYLQHFHIPISNSFHGDLNHDGTDEWLIWIQLNNTNPLLFISDGESYRIKSQFLYVPDFPTDYRYWFEWELPNGESAWGLYYFDDEHNYNDIWFSLYGYGGGGSIGYCLDKNGEFNQDLFAGDIALFRLTDEDNLDAVLYADICESVTLDDIFPNNSASLEVFAWDSDNNNDVDYPLIPTTFIWDGQEEKYVAMEVNDSSVKIVDVEPQSYYDNDHFVQNEISASLVSSSGDYEHILELTNNFLNYIDDAHNFTNIYIQAARYHRAFAYQQLGQYDKALADYVTLYTEAPDSAWGMLAGLHIEATTK